MTTDQVDARQVVATSLVTGLDHVGIAVADLDADPTADGRGAVLDFGPSQPDEAAELAEDGIRELARTAAQLNERMENIGARRLHTVMTTLLDDVLFEFPDRGKGDVVVDAAMVRERLREAVEDEDLRKYIL